MTDTQALRDLLVKVEAGDSFGIIPLGQKAFGPTDDYEYRRGHIVCNAFNGSLDAAKALHDAVLPDLPWDIWRGTDMNGGRYYGCNIATVDTAYHTDPARAWLICILRALIARATP